jgi:hypothetical protein
MNKGGDASFLFLWATGGAGIASIVCLGSLLWWLTPPSWRHYLDLGDGTGPLLVWFLIVPVGLAILGALGYVCGALAVSPFVCREDAEKAIRSGPYGGHIGKFERWVLSYYKPRSQ